MLFSDVDAIAKAASNKAELCNNHFGKYFMRSIMAGFYIVVATILSNVSAAVLLPTYPQFGKLLGAFYSQLQLYSSYLWEENYLQVIILLWRLAHTIRRFQ